MAELADALDSGSSEVTLIQVQVLLSAPQKESFDRKIGAFLFVSAGRYPARAIQFVQVRRFCCLRTCFCIVTKLPLSRPARQLPCTIPSSHRWRRCEKNRFHTGRSSPASACQPPQNQPYRVDPHARIVCRDSVFPVRAKAEIVFLQAKSKCFFLSGYQNFLLKSIRHLNKESCRQTAKYTKILDILPSPPYNKTNHSAKAA